jgi:hypothetical protein
MILTSIQDVKLTCPECKLVVRVRDAIVDGTRQRNGHEFVSDGSMGCPWCFYVEKKNVYLCE